MVVLKQIRLSRATSEPVEPFRLIDLQAVDTARRISTAARDDTDELMMASKRHDQQLLSDINAKLATQSFLPPPATVKRASAVANINPRKPPISSAVRSTSSVAKTNTAATTAAAAARRRLFQNFDRHSCTDDEAYAMPPTPVTRSVIRATSLPPTPPPPAAVAAVTDSNSRFYCPLTYAAMKLGESNLNGPTNTVVYSDLDSSSMAAQNGYGGYVRTRVTGPPPRLTPVTDLAIRQAHRDLDRIERELKYNPTEGSDHYKYLPKSFVAVTPTDKLTVRRPLPTATLVDSLTTSAARGGGPGTVGSLRVRAVSLSPARSVPSTTTYRTSNFSPATAIRRRTSPVRPSELVALMTIAPTTTVSDKRTPHVSSKLLYEIDQKPRQTQAYRARTEPSIYAVSSLSTADTTSAARHSDFPTSTRPKISEARRKVRDVLCKVKKDPHYFD